MRVQLLKVEDGLVPDSEIDLEEIKRIKTGEVVTAELRQVRNPAFHRMVFKMLHESFENQEKWTDFDKYREYLQIAAGLCEPIVKTHGEIWYSVKSLAWHKMDETEFQEAFQKLLTAAVERMGQDWLLERFG